MPQSDKTFTVRTIFLSAVVCALLWFGFGSGINRVFIHQEAAQGAQVTSAPIAAASTPTRLSLHGTVEDVSKEGQTLLVREDGTGFVYTVWTTKNTVFISGDRSIPFTAFRTGNRVAIAATDEGIIGSVFVAARVGVYENVAPPEVPVATF